MSYDYDYSPYIKHNLKELCSEYVKSFEIINKDYKEKQQKHIINQIKAKIC